MNNDVICAEGWLRNLILAADAHQLHIASPAMVEGELNYDFVHWAKEAEVSMRGYVRHGAPHAVCMAIRDDVWNDIGYFMPVPKLLGYEDGIFFQRAAEAGLKTGTTADSWLHHYGMTTQKALKLEMKLDQRDSLGSRNLMRLYMAQSWLTRKFSRHQRRRLVKAASAHELATFGKTVHGINTNLGKDWGWV
jgi:GT2 family glycosyltransferase